MSEENLQEGLQKEEPKEEPKQEVQTELPPVELEAREFGWRPKEEFEADPKNEGKKWRSAEEFMDRKSLFDKIEAQSHELKTLRKGMQSLGQHYTNVEKEAYKRALADLKAQRKQLLEDGDFVKAEAVRDQMDEVKEKMDSVKSPVTEEPQVPQEFIDWQSRNQWYRTDPTMTKFADDLGRRLAIEGHSPSEVLKEVEKRTKATFADKFRNPNRDTAPELVNPGRKAAPTKEGFRLTDDEERILTNMMKSGAPITREQYIADLKKMRS